MKLDMTAWKQARVGVVRSLKLDPDNVRLGLPVGASQREVIGSLYRDEDVLSLAKSIANVGWLTFEFPVVLKEGSDYVVVEGNRRIAALKGLIQPSLVPDYQARLAKLALQTDIELLKKIKVTLAPGLPEADMLIAALHTGNLRRPWGRARQAVFFERLLEDGYTTQELVDGFPTVEVRDLLRRGSMRRLFLAGVQNDAELYDYFNAPRTPMTVLERLTDNPEFLALARITVDPVSLQATTKLDAVAFESLASKIVGDMKSGTIDTRYLNSPELPTYKSYFTSLENVVDGAEPSGRRLAPAANSRSAGDGGRTGGVPKSSETEGPTAKETEKMPPAKAGTNLDFSGVVVAADLPLSISILTSELSKINYKRFPNATYDLLRSYLEKSIHAFAHRMGDDIPPRKPGQTVGLEACLLWLEGHTKDSRNGLRNFNHPVQLLRDQKAENRASTLGLMNSVNHNPELVVHHEHVAQLWAHLRGIIKFLVAPGQRPNSD